MDYEKLNAQYRAECQWPSVTDPALGIDPCHVESQARGVGEWAAKEIEGLRTQIEAHEHVHADHNRLVRELDVLINGQEGAAKQASLCDLYAQVRAILAASQAREAQMREALDLCTSAHYQEYALTALALPQDTTALDARIRAERAKERERCAALCDRFAGHAMHPTECAAAIRKLGDE